MADDDLPELLRSAIENAFRFQQSGERLASTITLLQAPIEAVGNLCESDPDLRPELATALASLGDAAAALTRAFEFAMARYAVAHEQIFPTTEGDSE